jgi:hypothetical protein
MTMDASRKQSGHSANQVTSKLVAWWIGLLLAVGCSSESGTRVVYVERDGAAVGDSAASDGWGSAGGANTDGSVCEDCDGDGFTKLRDCDDTNRAVHPSADCHGEPFRVNGRDSWDYDCNGVAVQDYTETLFSRSCDGSPPCCPTAFTKYVFETDVPPCGQGGQAYLATWFNEQRGCYEVHPGQPVVQCCR